MGETILTIDDLHVQVEGKPILRGVNLEVHAGEIHAVMGPNGAGKSTLVQAVLGHPRCEVTGGRIVFLGTDVTGMKCDERARRGLFLGFQNPVAVPGVSVANFLLAAMGTRRVDGQPQKISIKEFRTALKEKMAQLGIGDSFLGRSVNDGFSGGERKRLEVLQMLMLGPTMALLDETDSGLDIDALKTVAGAVNRYAGSSVGVLLVTHYQRLLGFVKPHRVHVLVDGCVVRRGGPDLALDLESVGYEQLAAEA
ncbi:MAG: Fe-S cluster assembly ATPase SufC [Candidatus Riflebacteria bacterium]|nr:Fe-S cluster assembly ATPase SufC [Candidatus Riflebacteria bacterium]